MGRTLLLTSDPASGLTGSVELETKIKCWRNDRSPGFSVFCAGTCNSRQACCFLSGFWLPRRRGPFQGQGGLGYSGTGG